MNQPAENIRKAQNLIRSATEPATSATVMIANVTWYSMNTASGVGVSAALMGEASAYAGVVDKTIARQNGAASFAARCEYAPMIVSPASRLIELHSRRRCRMR